MTAGRPTRGPGRRAALDFLWDALEAAAAVDPDVEISPVALLWPDPKREWTGVVQLLAALRPNVLALGEYAPAAVPAAGPAIFLRCAVEGTGDGPVPLVHLPGVSREGLRALPEALWALQPLAETRFRGAVFLDARGLEWTVEGFLRDSDVGPGLDLEDDAAVTRVVRSLGARVFEAPIEPHRAGRIAAADLQEMAARDPVGTLLGWLENPEGCRAGHSPAEESAWRETCRRQFEFDPGDVAAGDRVRVARLLAARRKGWAQAWERFAAAPENWPGIIGLLERSEPEAALEGTVEASWPGANRREEDLLRADLLELATASPGRARSLLPGLAAVHRARRDGIWARLGRAPLALALPFLARAARAAGRVKGDGTVDDLVEDYARNGWEADGAALEALAVCGEGGDAAAVVSVLATILGDWQEAGERRLGDDANGPRDRAESGEMAIGECRLFAPGLRIDLGHRLATLLAARGLAVETGWEWSSPGAEGSLGKLLASPLPRGTPAEDASPQRLPALLRDHGLQHLLNEEVGSPRGRAFAEFPFLTGALSSARDAALAAPAALEELARRVQGLVGAGWTRVMVVTDRGFLLRLGAEAEVRRSGTSLQEAVVPVIVVGPATA